MAYIYFGSYAPCGFLIVRDEHGYRDEANTVLIQTDWDFPGAAGMIGWAPRSETCDQCETDGTVPCRKCGKTASEYIAEAYDYLRECDGDSFPALDEYLN